MNRWDCEGGKCVILHTLKKRASPNILTKVGTGHCQPEKFANLAKIINTTNYMHKRLSDFEPQDKL